MSLSNFYLCYGASRYVATIQLKLYCQRFLSQSGIFSKPLYVFPDPYLDINIHFLTHHSIVDIIIFTCYNFFAPIWVHCFTRIRVYFMITLFNLFNKKFLNKPSDYSSQIDTFCHVTDFLLNWQNSHPDPVPFNRIMVTYTNIEHQGKLCIFLHFILHPTDNISHDIAFANGNDEYWNTFKDLGFTLTQNGYESDFLLGSVQNINLSELSNAIHEKAKELYPEQIKNMELIIVKL